MPLTSLLIYARDVAVSVDFYVRHFGFDVVQYEGDRITELVSPDGGASIMLHKAAKSQKIGQSTVKLVFAVRDVEAFCADSAEHGLVFGPVQHADGYSYANGRDPDKNSISVSSRAFLPTAAD